MFSRSIQNLIDSLAKLPSIGPRQAARIVFYILKKPEVAEKIAQDLLNMKKNVRLCKECFLSYEDKNDELCHICQNTSRKKNIICVLEKELEIDNIEKTGIFQGVYHIVGENLDILKKEETPKSIKRLLERIEALKKDGVEAEIIIATNPTTEGDAMMMYLERKLKPLDVKITKLGRGLATGGELEYADSETITSAFSNRN